MSGCSTRSGNAGEARLPRPVSRLVGLRILRREHDRSQAQAHAYQSRRQDLSRLPSLFKPTIDEDKIMTSKEKDAEVARLREELRREREQHDKTRETLLAAIKACPPPMTHFCPLPHVPQVVPQVAPQIAPWFVCEDCRSSTSGRCALHAITFITYPAVRGPDVIVGGPSALPLPSIPITSTTSH